MLEFDTRVDLKKTAELMVEAGENAKEITVKVMKKVFTEAVAKSGGTFGKLRIRLQQAGGVGDKVADSIGFEHTIDKNEISFRFGSQDPKTGKWGGVPASRNKDFNLAVALNVGVDPFPLNMIPTFKGTRKGHAFMYVKPSLFYSHLERQYIHSGITHPGFTEIGWLTTAERHIDGTLLKRLEKALEEI